MKVIYIGAVKSSETGLRTLLAEKVDIVGVFTLDPSKSHNVSDYVDLTDLCRNYQIPVYYFSNINSKIIVQQMKELAPNYIFVFGLSQLVSKEILSIPTHGCIGLHPALLPKGRGRASIPWTIINNEHETGLSIFFLSEGTDDGPIISQQKIIVDERETATTLYEKVCDSLIIQLKKLAPLIKKGKLEGIPQNELLATYTAKRTKEDGLIDWSQSNETIDRLIRAVTKPYPGAYTYYENEPLIFWDSQLDHSNKYCGVPGQIVACFNDRVIIACGSGCIVVKKVHYLENEYAAPEILHKVGIKLGINFEKEWLLLKKSLNTEGNK